MSHEQRFVDRLNAGEILVADGATATNYQQMGMAIGIAPEEWVFDEPDRVRGLHAAFIDAGADIILTDTFGGTSLRLRESRYAGRVTELNRRAAELARTAAAVRDGVLVAGSMGPTGMLMEPLGELTATAAADAYREQAAALEEGGVDLLLLETFFALDEALAAIEGIRRASAPTWNGLSMSWWPSTPASLYGSSPTPACRAWLVTWRTMRQDRPRWPIMRCASSRPAPASSAAAAVLHRGTLGL